MEAAKNLKGECKMKKIIILPLLFLINLTLANANCFIAAENNKILEQAGECTSRHAPCSTFKIALSLMGYNEGILIDEVNPELPFKKGYTEWLEVWKQPHTPTSWMKHSCVWYSQVITKELGAEKFQDYVIKLHYGNQDISGDPGQNNSLIKSWISSSLKISPEEQIIFLQKLVDNKLPVSAKSNEMTKKILFLESLEGGWKLYGKTGSGHVKDPNDFLNEDTKLGWFIGWIEKGDRTIVFAHYLEGKEAEYSTLSQRAKAMAKEKVISLTKAH